MTSRLPVPAALIALFTIAVAGCGGNDSSTPASYTVGGAVSGLASGQNVVLANNGTDSLSVSGNGAFGFKTPVAQNGAYAVTVATPPAGQKCTVSGGSGTASSNVTSVSVSCTAATYIVGGTVSGLNTGVQITLQDNGTDSVTVNENGSFTFPTPLAYNALYTVTIVGQPTVRGQNCSVQAGAGAVTDNVTTVQVICSGAAEYVYVVETGANVVSLLVVGTGGALGALSTTSVATGNGPVSIAVDPLYRYAYVTNYTDGTVSQYSIPKGGVLTALMSAAGSTPVFGATVPTGSGAASGPTAIAVDPKGKFVYVLNARDGTVSQFAIGAGGELNPLSVPTVPTGLQPVTFTPASQPPVLAGSLAIDPDDRFVFVTSPVSSTVTQYSIGADGSLTALAALTASTGNMPLGMAISPVGSFAYVANYTDNTLSQFSLGSTGLTALAGASVATPGTNPVSVAIDPTGKYLYEADNNAGAAGTVSEYTIGTSGALTAMNVPDVAAGMSPEWVTVDLTGQYVYVANTFDGTVSQYAITTGGGLAPLTVATVATGSNPTAIAVAYGQ
jgi:6-phosphogluconolactonase (cycloisomerase 2 family)